MARSKAFKLLEIFNLIEDMGLDALKADLPGSLKSLGFNPQEIEKIVKEAPNFIDGKEEWTSFLRNAGLTELAKAATRQGANPMSGTYRPGKQVSYGAQKLQGLARFMARLKHNV